MDRTSTSAFPAIFLVASFATGTVATALPLWEAPKIETKSAFIASTFEIPVATNIQIAKPVNPIPFITLKDRVIKVLESYETGHPGSDPSIFSKSEDIKIAKNLIEVLPSGLPLPTVMRNDDGEIGMYWDNDDVYIDINIDPDSSLSLFSRIRSTGVEEFFSEINIKDINAAWAYEHLAALTQNYAKAA